jgi:hypothetical protein
MANFYLDKWMRADMHYRLYSIRRIYSFHSCIQKGDLLNDLGECYLSYLQYTIHL